LGNASCAAWHFPFDENFAAEQVPPPYFSYIAVKIKKEVLKTTLREKKWGYLSGAKVSSFFWRSCVFKIECGGSKKIFWRQRRKKLFAAFDRGREMRLEDASKSFKKVIVENDEKICPANFSPHAPLNQLTRGGLEDSWFNFSYQRQRRVRGHLFHKTFYASSPHFWSTQGLREGLSRPLCTGPSPLRLQAASSKERAWSNLARSLSYEEWTIGAERRKRTFWISTAIQKINIVVSEHRRERKEEVEIDDDCPQ
jgi:hypothetical protein